LDSPALALEKKNVSNFCTSPLPQADLAAAERQHANVGAELDARK
jgi:hypothetical protein